MRKNVLPIVLFFLFLAAAYCGFAGCRITGVEVQELPAITTTVLTDVTALPATTATEAPLIVSEQTAVVSILRAEETTTAASAGSDTPSTAEITSAVLLPEAESVTLPIALPEANGTMEVSVDPTNAYIRAVSEGRGIETSLLAAVYAVPQSGQNYVFEFRGTGERSAQSLRRVYLLTDDLQIKSVAASSAAERERISLTENWFCMNVLIKGVIFPSVQDKMQ